MSGLATSYVNADLLPSSMKAGGNSFADPLSDVLGIAGVDVKDTAASHMNSGAFQGNRGEGDAEYGTPLYMPRSYSKRLLAFAVTFAIGVLFAIFSLVAAFTNTGGTFAVIYTFALLFTIGSTIFLCGPLKQLMNLRELPHMIPAIVIVVLLILTYVFGAETRFKWVAVITIILQLVAMVWYSVNYIPHARDVLRAKIPLFP